MNCRHDVYKSYPLADACAPLTHLLWCNVCGCVAEIDNGDPSATRRLTWREPQSNGTAVQVAVQAFAKGLEVRLKSGGMLYIETPPPPLSDEQRREVARALRGTADYVADLARYKVLEEVPTDEWVHARHLDAGGDLAVTLPGADAPNGKRLPYMTREQVVEVVDILRESALTIEEAS